MDPLSLLASIAGVSTAGVALSKAIYNILSSIRDTPREVSDIARGVSDLSIILGELRRVLRRGADLHRRTLLRQVRSTVRRIERTHEDIHELVAGVDGLARLKWLFRRSKTMHLLYQIESYKTGINLTLQIMTLAITQREISSGSTGASDPKDEDGADAAEAAMSRQQAENLVQVSYQSIRDLVTGDGEEDPFPRRDSPDPEKGPGNQLQRYKDEVGADASNNVDTARWLYDLVFTPSVEPSGGTHDEEDHKASTPRPSGAASDSDKSSNALVFRAQKAEEMQLLISSPVPVSSVVDDLLSEWTTLTKDEISGIITGDQPPQQAESSSSGPSRAATGDAKVEAVRFTDGIGRRFTFPYHICNTWKGMEDLITQAFEHVAVWNEKVRQGCYDILGPDAKPISVSLWESTIKPGDRITMSLWPLQYGGLDAIAGDRSKRKVRKSDKKPKPREGQRAHR